MNTTSLVCNICSPLSFHVFWKPSFSKLFGKSQQNTRFLVISLFYYGGSTFLTTNIFALPRVAWQSFFTISLICFCSLHMASKPRTLFTPSILNDRGRLFLQSRLPSSHQRCSVKKLFLKISQDLQENTCARFSLLIKLQAWGILVQVFSCEFFRNF